MYAEYQSKAFGFKLAVTSSIFKLIRWLLRYQRTRLSPTCTEDSGEDTKKMAAFRQLLVTINEDSALTITAEEAAKLCLMSYSGFASFLKASCIPHFPNMSCLSKYEEPSNYCSTRRKVSRKRLQVTYEANGMFENAFISLPTGKLQYNLVFHLEKSTLIG